MKKQFFILALLLFFATKGFAQFTLRAVVPSTTNTCFISGGFNSWLPLANTPMALQSTDNVAGTKVFSVNLPLKFVGSTTFKIAAGAEWAFEQADPQFTATAIAGDVSQEVTVTSFKALPFPIDISVTVPAEVNVCYLSGPWGWNLPAAAHQMTLISSNPNSKVFGYAFYDKVGVHSLALKFLAGLDATNWTYSQNQTTDFLYNGSESSASFTCDAFKAYAPTPTAINTVKSDNYSIKIVDNKILVEGQFSTVALFDLQGKLIQSVRKQGVFTSGKLNAGIYIVRVDNKSYKQIIK